MEDPQAELATTDHQTPNKSQNNNATSTKVTLELRKYILLLASLVATVTYAAGFSPPGDVWQDTADGHLAGDPIIRDTHRKRYVAFFYCNATAFAASLVVIVITLTLAYLDDYKDKYSDSKIVVHYTKRQWIAVRTLQAAMVSDLLSLMGAYAAGTCRDTFTTVYSSLLVGFVFFYLVVQVTVAWCYTGGSGGVPEGQVEERQPAAVPDDARSSVAGGNPHHSASGGVVPEVREEEERHDAPGSGGGVPEAGAVEEEEEGEERQKAKKMFLKVKVLTALASVKIEQDKAKERFRKVLMLLATFAVSITYLAGLSTPGGFWDSAGDGHGPGDAILKDNHNTRLAVFFCFNTLAFVASLLIIVVLLDTKPHRHLRQGFIVVALFSLIVAYNAGSCRQTDTTVYVFSLVPAVLVYILFLYFLADHIYDKWEKMKTHFRTRWLPEPSTPSTRNGRLNANGSRVREGKTEKQKAADKARSLVLLLATLAATITYQAGLEPPGGVWQDNSGGHMAGDPILLTTNPRRYKAFFYCNSVSLVASLVAIVLVQRKLLLKHHVLEAVMILDLFGLIGAYAAGSSRDVNTSIHAMALAGAVLVYVVIHVIFITLDDNTRTTRSESDKKNGNELVEKTRKRLLLFAIFAATITYQAGLTPPGGFLLKDGVQSGVHHHAGDPILLNNFPRRYKAFFYCNSVSFMLSIAVIILLVNPNLYRPAIRTHALSVCTAVGLFGLMGAYAAGSTQHLKTSVYIFALVAVVIFFIVLLFLVFWFTGCSGKTPQGAPPTETNNAQDKEEDMETKEKKIIHANRKYLMLLGILVASVTYQAGLEPPGGAWQSSDGGHEAGNSVMHDNRRHRYLAFFYSNSTSFMASVVVILLLLVPPEKLIGDRNEKWRRRWLVVMNTTIVLDLLGLLGAYAAGSSRGWKTCMYVLLLVLAVLAYMAFHLVLSCIIRKRNRSAQQQVDSAAAA
ncbi:hypothetical protein BDA96_05G040800 [Sorghum bicolor]|uniref:PGG domain-containing protein n=1 Tax=Sorghum bicolor TaxID=4558 RepID=A0A921QXR5_SORBI|nr:hypothetical protein BDA96_05G040800 [Sorghum bicolor]